MDSPFVVSMDTIEYIARSVCVSMIAKYVVNLFVSLLLKVLLKECVYRSANVAMVDAIERHLRIVRTYPLCLQQHHFDTEAVYARRVTRRFGTFVVRNHESVRVYRWFWLKRLVFEPADDIESQSDTIRMSPSPSVPSSDRTSPIPSSASVVSILMTDTRHPRTTTRRLVSSLSLADLPM